MKATASNLTTHHKSLARIVLGTVFVLLIPLIAMQFTDEVAWTTLDFVVAGALLLGVGVAVELVSGLTKHSKYRTIVIAVIIVLFVLAWIELAVGLFGTPFAGS